MNWKPGDIGIVVDCGSYPKQNGNFVTVTSTPYIDPTDGVETVTIESVIVDDGRPCGLIATACLRKPYDDYDGHQVTTWDKCIWQPTVTEEVR